VSIVKTITSTFALLGLLLLAPTAPVAAQSSDAADIEFWQSVKQSGDPAELRAYLKAFPNGRFAPLARIRIRKLLAAQAAKLANNPPTKAAYRALSLFAEIFDRIRADYIDPTDPQALISAAIAGIAKKYPSDRLEKILKSGGPAACRPGAGDSVPCLRWFGLAYEAALEGPRGREVSIADAALSGMVGTLDKSSAYYSSSSGLYRSPEDKKNSAGVGLELTMQRGIVLIVKPIANSPALAAGIRAGDAITHVDGASLANLTLSSAVKRITGAPGSSVTLTIKRRRRSKPLHFKLTRKAIHLPTVFAYRYGHVGYVVIRRFDKVTSKDLIAAVEKLLKSDRRLKGLVIDLRNNPGGPFFQCVETTDAFLERGKIVVTRARRKKDMKHYFAKPGDILSGRNLILLVNGGTAGTAEIVAAALSEHKRAITVGTRTVGHAGVQTVIPLASHTAIKITTARYHTPAGKSLSGNGVVPDHEVWQNAPAIFKTEQARSTYVPSDRHRDRQLQFALKLARSR